MIARPSPQKGYLHFGDSESNKRKFLAVCRSHAVRRVLRDPQLVRRNAALLHAMLAGDMRGLGLELWSLRRREVPEGVQVQPAMDRIAVQKVAAAEVKALVEARRGLIAQL